MQKTPPTLNRREHRDLNFGRDYLDFLKHLEGPTLIDVPGTDHSRYRAIVTLLHGNEPSGLKAVDQLLRHNIIPATDLTIIIASVNAALHPPVLSHRFLPWEADMNRCFDPPCITDQNRLAEAIITELDTRKPEAVVDTHNTSAHSEPFAVCLADTESIRQLTGIFADNLVVMDQTLGTLLERGNMDNPWLTVEFGGIMDPRADTLAFETLVSFITSQELFEQPSKPMQTLYHPLRLEIVEDARIHYSSSVIHNSHITMFNTIDQLNFQRIEAGTPLGWLSPDGLEWFRIRGGNKEKVENYFCNNNGFLTTRKPFTLFMSTTDPYIAQKDCLLYFTP